ncbi:386_t:CDS:2, partial [Acaulospora colombiana]
PVARYNRNHRKSFDAHLILHVHSTSETCVKAVRRARHRSSTLSADKNAYGGLIKLHIEMAEVAKGPEYSNDPGRQRLAERAIPSLACLPSDPLGTIRTRQNHLYHLRYIYHKSDLKGFKEQKPMEKRDSSSITNHDEKERSSDLEHPVPILGKDGAQADKQLDISLALPGMLGVHKDDEVDPAESRRVKRKLDWRIVPLLMM